MTQRLIIGRHPLDGSYGVWLSIPGVDATTTVNPTNFLICPGVKNEMVLMAGTAVNGQVVPFPETFSAKPFVAFTCSSGGGVDWYPFNPNVVTKFGTGHCYVWTSQMQFTADDAGYGLTFEYLVTNRALP
jgi:hypothetical protein